MNMERNLPIYRRMEDLKRKVEVKDCGEAGRERETTLAPDFLGLKSCLHEAWTLDVIARPIITISILLHMIGSVLNS